MIGIVGVEVGHDITRVHGVKIDVVVVVIVVVLLRKPIENDPKKSNAAANVD